MSVFSCYSTVKKHETEGHDKNISNGREKIWHRKDYEHLETEIRK